MELFQYPNLEGDKWRWDKLATWQLEALKDVLYKVHSHSGLTLDQQDIYVVLCRALEEKLCPR